MPHDVHETKNVSTKNPATLCMLDVIITRQLITVDIWFSTETELFERHRFN